MTAVSAAATRPSRLTPQGFGRRLTAELAGLGHTLDLESLPLQSIGARDILHVGLLAGSEMPTWYGATLNGVAVGVYLSEAEALTGLLLALHGEFDSRFDSLERRGPLLVALAEGAPLAQIQRLEFTEVDQTSVARAAGALKGVAAHDLGRLVRRLHDIPGLGNLVHRTDARRPLQAGPAVHRTPANIAAALRNELAGRGVALSTSAGQELLARAAGARNWSTLLGTDHTRVAYPVEVAELSISQTADLVVSSQYFRGEAEAMAYYALYARSRGSWPLKPVLGWDDSGALQISGDIDFESFGPSLVLEAAKWGGGVTTAPQDQYAYDVAVRFLSEEDPRSAIAEYFDSEESFSERAEAAFPEWRQIGSMMVGDHLRFRLLESTSGDGQRRLHGQHRFDDGKPAEFKRDPAGLRIGRGVDGLWYLVEQVDTGNGRKTERLMMILQGATTIAQLGDLVTFSGMQPLFSHAFDKDEIRMLIGMNPDYGAAESPTPLASREPATTGGQRMAPEVQRRWRG